MSTRGGVHVGEGLWAQCGVYGASGLITRGIVPPALVSGCAKLNCSSVHDVGMFRPEVTGFCSDIREAVLQSSTNVGMDPFGQGYKYKSSGLWPSGLFGSSGIPCVTRILTARYCPPGVAESYTK